ncbi:MAG: sugar ABC transporter permease [Clostridia bacterium]|nr:sugar ABC transporter permease [Clostridia bacterium]
MSDIKRTSTDRANESVSRTKNIGAILLESFKKDTMLYILVIVYIFFLILTKGGIFRSSSFTELVNQNTYVYIIGTGMLMCMLTGGNIDLSCGSFVCLLGALGGIFMVLKGVSAGVSILLMLAIGIAYGTLLGWLIAYVHIPPWIATLAGYLAFRGLGTSILQNNSATSSLSPIPVEFRDVFYGRIFPTKEGEMNWPCFIAGIVAAAVIVTVILVNRKNRVKKGYEVESIGKTYVKCGIGCAVILLLMTKLALGGGIPTSLLWVVGIVLTYNFITSRTTIGRHFYVVGGNIEAARLSGVNTRRIMFIAYLNMAVLTSIATMTVISRSQSANSFIGNNFEMDAISACVVGGVSASGGSGTVLDMVIGATLIGIINLGMSLISLDANYQSVVKGFVLLAAVVFDILSHKRKK